MQNGQWYSLHKSWYIAMHRNSYRTKAIPRRIQKRGVNTYIHIKERRQTRLFVTQVTNSQLKLISHHKQTEEWGRVFLGSESWKSTEGGPLQTHVRGSTRYHEVLLPCFCSMVFPVGFTFRKALPQGRSHQTQSTVHLLSNLPVVPANSPTEISWAHSESLACSWATPCGQEDRICWPTTPEPERPQSRGRGPACSPWTESQGQSPPGDTGRAWEGREMDARWEHQRITRQTNKMLVNCWYYLVLCLKLHSLLSLESNEN